MRRMLLVAMVAVLGLGIGLVAWERTGDYTEFCELAIALAGDEVPEGWECRLDQVGIELDIAEPGWRGAQTAASLPP